MHRWKIPEWKKFPVPPSFLAGRHAPVVPLLRVGRYGPGRRLQAAIPSGDVQRTFAASACRAAAVPDPTPEPDPTVALRVASPSSRAFAGRSRTGCWVWERCLLGIAVGTCLLYKVYPRKVKETAAAAEMAREKLKAMGPVSRNE